MHEAEIPADIVGRLRRICADLPEITEHEMSAGWRWCIRKQVFAWIHSPSERRDFIFLLFRSEPPELMALHNAGPPFFRPRWYDNGAAMRIDDDTDWDEVAELLVDSYRVVAPKKLAALLGDA